MLRGHIVKTADINCIDANGSEAKVTATCNVAEDDSDSQDVMLRMKNAAQVHVAISCNTTKR